MEERPRRLPQHALPHGPIGRLVGEVTPLFHGWFYPRVARVLDLRSDDDVLDVACGSGRFLKRYAAHARSIAGIDLSPAMVKAATRANRRRVASGTAEFAVGDASAMPWHDSRFSAVCIMGSFVAFPGPREVLRELHRVLRPGGRMVVLVEQHADDGLDHRKEVERWGMQLLSEDEVRSIVEDVGFSAIRITQAEGPSMPNILIVCGSKV